MSPMTSACCVPRDHGPGVVEHLGHRDAHGRSRSRAAPGRANRRRGSSGCRRRRGSARSGSRRRSASGSARRRRSAGRCRRRSGGDGGESLTEALMCIASLRRGVAGVQRTRRPGRGSDPRPRAWSAAAARRGAVGVEDRHPVRVGPEARSRAPRTSFATSRSTPFAGACRRRDRASRSPRRTRRGSGAGHRLVGRLAVAVRAVRDPRDLAEDVRGRLELEGQPAAALDLRRSAARRRPEVGDRGGHDQRVEARAPVLGVGRADGARRAARRSTRRGRSSASVGERHLDGRRRSA